MQKISRRQWLKMTAATATALAAGNPITALAKTDKGGPGFGVQLYTARHMMEANVADTLAKTAATGCREVELAGLFDHSPSEFKQLLNKNGLTAPASHIPLPEFENNFDQALETALALGNKYLVLPYILPEQRKTFDIYKHIAELLNSCGEKSQKVGVTVAYHNHEFEFDQFEEGQPLEYLLNNTDANLVSFELDLYWVTQAKQDPVSIFKQHPGRFPLWHIKDLAKDGSITDVGKGTIDFKRIFDVADIAGLKHGFIEHDKTKDPIATFHQGFKELTSLGFAVN